MKLIKKSKCKFENGYIVKGSKIVGMPSEVYRQLKFLEIMVQEYEYIKAQPAYQPAPTLEGFEPKSALSTKRPYMEKPDTPTIDKRTGEALEFMAEVDAVNEAAHANGMIDRLGALIDWLAADKFVEGNCFDPIDTPTLGNPLELTPGKVADKIIEIMGDDVLFGF